jgi:hypothetical protein
MRGSSSIVTTAARSVASGSGTKTDGTKPTSGSPRTRRFSRRAHVYEPCRGPDLMRSRHEFCTAYPAPSTLICGRQDLVQSRIETVTGGQNRFRDGRWHAEVRVVRRDGALIRTVVVISDLVDVVGDIAQDLGTPGQDHAARNSVSGVFSPRRKVSI